MKTKVPLGPDMSNIVAFCTAHVYSAFSCFFCCSPATIDSIGQSSHVHLSHDPQTTMEATRGLKSSQTGYIGKHYRLEKGKKCKRKFAFEKVWVSWSSIFPLISPYPVLPQPTNLSTCIGVVAIATLVQ